MNILFLDYDGVVNTPIWDAEGKTCRYGFPEDGKVNNFQSVQWVSEFCQSYGYDIVVTSTWRYDDNWEECLRNGGLREGIRILGKTPILRDADATRGQEIQAFLNSVHGVDSFVILDDDRDMDDMMDHLVKCNPNRGFGLTEYEKAVQIHIKYADEGKTVTEKEIKTREDAIEYVKANGYPFNEDSPFCAVVALRRCASILPEFGCDGSKRNLHAWALFDMAGKIDTGEYGEVYYFG